MLAILVGAACPLAFLGGVGVVSAGIVRRCLLDDPLGWSDEVALAVLSATTFLGSALTLQRREHFGIGVLRARMGRRWGARADGASGSCSPWTPPASPPQCPSPWPP